MDFVSSTGAAENRDCSKFICGASTTSQGYGIEKNKKNEDDMARYNKPTIPVNAETSVRDSNS